MEALAWIIVSGLAMSGIALIGGLTLFLQDSTLKKITLPLVAFSAGSLIGGAFFYMIPASIETMGNSLAPFCWIVAGFTAFFALEQLLHWHHCHRAEASCKKPLTYLILIGDGLHNFIGGLAIAGTFLVDIRLGIMTWLAAVTHEVPQELGDFAVLIHGGWSKAGALAFNVLSALTFLLGGLIAYTLSFNLDISFLVPFAAGNFIYIGATDLIPEVNKHSRLKNNLIHFAAFLGGVLVILATRTLMG
jgi:zinc and cadmium transporter